MNRIAIIATHHKTGTVWMNSTFRQVGKVLGIRFVSIHRDPAMAEAECAPPMIVAAAHSKFGTCRWLLRHPERRIFHLIRDPRDVVISGMHYHRAAQEKWLFEPRDDLGGMSYQAKLNSLTNDRERYLFEMDNAGMNTTMAMQRWSYDMSESFECKYEDLIEDVDMSLFTKVVKHLGFSDAEVAVCRNAFWKKSIFGARRKPQKSAPHIRSGEARQWPSVFDQRMGEEFVKRFGDALVKLGYEEDHSWIARLPPIIHVMDSVST